VADGLQAWRDWFHPLLDISLAQSERGPFSAENRVWNINGILLSSVTAPATCVKRGKFNISRSPIDHWVFSYNRSGTTVIATDKTSLQAPPRAPFLWSLGDKTSSRRSDVDRIQLLIPRDMFWDIAPVLDASRGGVLNTPLSTMLGDYMLFLENRLSAVSAPDLPGLGDAVRGMINACLAPSRERAQMAARQMDYCRRERVRQMIHANLRSPSLYPAAICKAVGMSRSQLYRLFEHSDGVVRYIQRQRLLRCHTILSDPQNAKSIPATAEEFGFMDVSTFRRAFRREFGQSPSDVRSASRSGMPIVAKPRDQTPKSPRRFYDLLVENARVF